MVFKGFDALGYKEHHDYEIVQVLLYFQAAHRSTLLQSTNPLLNKAVVRVNVFRSHRQTIQYIQPQVQESLPSRCQCWQDCEKLAQAELLLIDEAAAIPLPIVKALMGPYLVRALLFLFPCFVGFSGHDLKGLLFPFAIQVFMSSTVNGYEGTGRSLSLKLVRELRYQSAATPAAAAASPSASGAASSAATPSGRSLREVRIC